MSNCIEKYSYNPFNVEDEIEEVVVEIMEPEYITLKGKRFKSLGKYKHGTYKECKGARIYSRSNVQEKWDNRQNHIVIPSRYIIQRKKAPVYLLCGISMKSGSGAEGYMMSGQGEGTRIMDTRFYGDLCNILKKYRGLSQSTINKDLKNMLQLDIDEFRFVNNKTPKGRDKYCYEINYDRGGFVLADISIMDYLLRTKSNISIQLYLNLLWICRNGWTKVTRKEMCTTLGLSEKSEKMIKKALDELIESGIVQMRKSYKEETIMDNNMPKILKIPTFEYKITDINNEDYHYKENYISI